MGNEYKTRGMKGHPLAYLGNVLASASVGPSGPGSQVVNGNAGSTQFPKREPEACLDNHSVATCDFQGMVLGMRERTRDTAFGFGLAEGGWVFLWVSGGDGLLRQELAILPNCSAFE